MEKGDLLLAGRIFTGRRFVDALVVREGRIAYAGGLEEARRRWACDASISHRDGVILPGLIDAHMHLTATGLGMMGVDLRGSRSIREMAERVSGLLETRGYAIAGGWDQEMFMEGRYPTAADLDKISLDRPVILYRFCSHAAVVNSHVLRASGVRRETPDPPGGIIGRDGNGEPDGMFFDTAIEKYIYPMESELTRSAGPSAVRKAADGAASMGLTTLMAMSADRDELDAIREALRRGPLKCRLRIFVSRSLFDELGDGEIRGMDEDMVRISGLKLFADGAFGSRTALLTSPYSDMDTRGIALMPESQMESYMARANAMGLIVAVHAIGDMAAENVLNTAARLNVKSPMLRIEHIALTTERVLGLLARVRPTLVVQPHFLVGDWWLARRLGGRISSCYLFRTYREMGLAVAGSSDSPVEPLDPWTGIRTAVDRGAHAGVDIAQITAAEALDVYDAIRMYTADAAVASDEEGSLGTLEEGAFADAVFVEGEPSPDMSVSPHVLATMLGGMLVYDAEGRFGGAVRR